MKDHYDAVIVGGGPAGLTAAVYARRAGLSALVIEGGVAGGQINLTDEIENYPGLPKMGGMDLGRAFREQAESFGAEFMDANVTALSVGDKKTVRTDKGEVEASALIIASGASFREAGVPGEREFAGRGVSRCAVCDAAFYSGAPVVVIGGGNTAVKEAVFIARFASKVWLVHRRDELRASRREAEAALSNPKIEPIWDSVVDEIAGGAMVERVRVKNVKTGETRELAAEGVFVFVGTRPNAGFLDGCPEIERSDGGWIKTDDRMMTSAPGVFAAGDVREKFLRQVVTAASDGAIAGIAAYDYIQSLSK